MDLLAGMEVEDCGKTFPVLVVGFWHRFSSVRSAAETK
jgi:hypothetical protein